VALDYYFLDWQVMKISPKNINIVVLGFRVLGFRVLGFRV
jgi:hypothetical protein